MLNSRRAACFALVALLGAAAQPSRVRRCSAIPSTSGVPVLCRGTARTRGGRGAPTTSWRTWSPTPKRSSPRPTPVIVRMETLAPRRALCQPRRQGRRSAAVVGHRPCIRDRSRRGFDDARCSTPATWRRPTSRSPCCEASVSSPTAPARSPASSASPTALAMINRAITLRPDDASLRFAAALVAATADRTAYRDHADKARKGAAQDTLLARNIDKLG